MAIATYSNYLAKVLSSSAWGATTYKTTAASPTATGTSANETFYDIATGATLSGGKGDDTYYVTSQATKVVEAASSGTDTVITYVSYGLSDNIENLTIGGSNITGTGNALDNIIVSNGTRNVLIGGKGNDVLISNGAAGQRFMFAKGDGQDVIIGFKTGTTHDFVRVDGFETWDAIKANLSQVGSDVLLKLAGSDAILFKDKLVADFSAADFLFKIDTTKMTMSFDEEFNSLSLYNASTGTGIWKTNFISGSQDSIWTGYSSRTLAPNHEQQIYVDPSLTGSGTTALGLNPFSIDNGVLTITASKATAEQSAALWGYQYTSGLLTTEKSFAQKYGYFEIRADLPTGQGVWPAFWLLPSNQAKTAELDIMESINGSDTVVQTVHTAASGTATQDAFSTVAAGLASGYHTYGMLWTAETITWYVDGVAVGSIATPADMNTEMYLLVNLAIGGDWPGAADSSFTSADYKIDYVRAYTIAGSTVTSTASASTSTGTKSSSSSSSAVVVADVTSLEAAVTTTMTSKLITLTLTGHDAINGTGNDLDNTITGNDAANRLLGGAGADTLHGGAGNDLLDGGTGTDHMYGGAGDDSYVVDNVNDVIVELAGEGWDSVTSSVTYHLSANIEQLTLTGTANIDAYGNDTGVTLIGNSGANTLYGGAGNDVLDGGKGIDKMVGGAGDDTYYVDNASDVVVEQANGGTDTVMSSVTYRLPDNVENLTLLWTGGSWAYGNASDNVLTGNSGDNRLYGYGGNDTLIGGAGNDVLDGGYGNDILTGGTGADTFVYIRGGGHDVITDFGVGDVLDLSAYSQAGIKGQVVDTSAGVTITFSANDSILLQQVHLDHLTATSSGYIFH